MVAAPVALLSEDVARFALPAFALVALATLLVGGSIQAVARRAGTAPAAEATSLRARTGAAHRALIGFLSGTLHGPG
jgi:hypothetical protein